jgi:hypothetical protein
MGPMNEKGLSFLWRSLLVTFMLSRDAVACSKRGVRLSMECPLAHNLSMKVVASALKLAGVFCSQ